MKPASVKICLLLTGRVHCYIEILYDVSKKIGSYVGDCGGGR